MISADSRKIRLLVRSINIQQHKMQRRPCWEKVKPHITGVVEEHTFLCESKAEVDKTGETNRILNKNVSMSVKLRPSLIDILVRLMVNAYDLRISALGKLRQGDYIKSGIA